MVRLLLEAGAEANSFNNLGNTPLQFAVAYGKLTCARELIPHTDLLHFSADGNNALHHSIICNQPEIFKLLLPHFADDVDVPSSRNAPRLTLTVRTTARHYSSHVRVDITPE